MIPREVKTLAITPQRVGSMALHMTIDQIAERLGLEPADIVVLLTRAGRPRASWGARCLKTGKLIPAYSERSAYLKAQIAGFADWRFERVGGAA